jgi:hypothetical protein
MGLPMVGKRHRRETNSPERQLGNLEEYPNESRAQAAADALRLIINEEPVVNS